MSGRSGEHAWDCRCSRDCCLDSAAQQYVDALAERDALTVAEAVEAAGARTPAEVERLTTLIQAQRQEQGRG